VEDKEISMQMVVRILDIEKPLYERPWAECKGKN
jgi:hypothetical protein